MNPAQGCTEAGRTRDGLPVGLLNLSGVPLNPSLDLSTRLLLQVCSARVLSLQPRKPGREEGSPRSGPGLGLGALPTSFLLTLPTAH